MITGVQYGFYKCASIAERDDYDFPTDLDVIVVVESSPSVTYVGRNGVFKSITGSGSGGYDGDPATIIQDSTHRFVSDAEKSTWDSKADSLGADDNYMTDAEKTKLSGITAGATVNSTDATLLNADNHTDGSTNKVFSATNKTKLGHITVTQAVDLDDIETRVNNLDAAVVLKGTWDASTGTFPGGGTAQAGASYIVSVGGTVDSVVFNIGDRAIAILDNASTGTFASNWFKADYTDQVLSVNGQTGAVSLTTANVADSADKRYCTDAQKTVIGNTSGINSGNETASTIGATINGSSAATPNDTDLVATVESSVVKKITWANIKAFFKTYFDTIYTTPGAVVTYVATQLSSYLTTAAAAIAYQPKATGTPDGSKYLRDDNSWQSVSVSSSDLDSTISSSSTISEIKNRVIGTRYILDARLTLDGTLTLT